MRYEESPSLRRGGRGDLVRVISTGDSDREVRFALEFVLEYAEEKATPQ